MRHHSARVALVLMCVLSHALFGCAIVDKFSSRAVDYNTEAEKAQQQALLLNIIRASLRRPMQFTTVQSITGTASATGGATYSLPVNIPARQSGPLATNTYPPLTTWGFNASMTGGPAFIVPVLDTQEFYQGILTPIQIQIFDYYLKQGFPSELMFDLLVANIEVIVHDGSCRRFSLRNDVRDELHFNQFQAFIEYLLVSGLTTEHIQKITRYGPPIAEPAPGSEGEAAKMVEAYSKASAAGLEIKKSGDYFQLQKKKPDYRFCFAQPQGPRAATWIRANNDAIFCGRYKTPQSVLADEEHVNECAATEAIRLHPAFIRRMWALEQQAIAAGRTIADEDHFDGEAFGRAPVSFKINIRSTDGMLYYLGEITRTNLFPEGSSERRIIQVKSGLRYGEFPMSECDSRENGGSYQQKSEVAHLLRLRTAGHYSCENLFLAELGGIPGDTFLSVGYDGKEFSIPADRARTGRSSQVLELVKQMLAINTSAKQLPATTVISVVGQ